MHDDEIKSYYADAQLEWDRLAVDFPYEKYITTHMMDRYLPKEGTILDIGGGPGHYSMHYASRGYEVTLFDLSPNNLSFAQQRAANEGLRLNTVNGNALDLSAFEDEQFDAVFLMGPLYHLLEEFDRRQALSEACRVLKRGGHLFCSFILTNGHLTYLLRDKPEAILDQDQRSWLDAIAGGTGVAFKPFTYAHETTVEEAEQLVGSVDGIDLVASFGQESILAPYAKQLAAASDDVRQAWYDYALEVCDKRDYLSHSEHLMVVARKA